MFHGYVHAVDGAQNAPALLLQHLRETLDFRSSGAEQRIELLAKGGVVRGNRRQHAGMTERRFQFALEFADTRNYPGFEQRVEIDETFGFLLERTELTQYVDMLFRQVRHVGVGKNFNECDLEWREGQRSVQPVAATFPLTGDTRMAIEESCDHVGFVAADFALVFLP